MPSASRGLSVLLAAGVAASAGVAGSSSTPEVTHMDRNLGTVGLYVQPPAAGQAHYLDFYKACGYNYLEFCEAGFARRPDVLPAYYKDFAASVARAKRKGFKVGILLLAGMKQHQGPGVVGDGAGTFSALETDQLNERLGYIRQAVRGLKGADGFQFFAGDPGGDPQGRATIADCVSFARAVGRIVREEAPRARFAVNVWAIAEWAGFPSPFTFEFWRQQVRLARELTEFPDLLGPECGVLFSMDNAYRSLALTTYADAGVEPEQYPRPDDIRRLRERGATPIYGWPYFLVDECDDGFVTPNNVATGGQSQAETRYIRAIVDHGMALGLDGLVANASFVAAEPLDIWAFGRMCRDPRLSPEAALDAFAGLIADDATRAPLGQVLRFIENRCNWQNSLPARFRLPDFDCGSIRTVADAGAALASVRPKPKPPIVLPEAPADYLARLARRLDRIAAGDIGGPNPAYKPQGRPQP